MERSYIPWFFVIGISFFMILDLCFIGLAKSTYTGVYTENYYQKGVDFDKINRQSIYHDKTGWKTNVTYDRSTKQMKFSITDAQGQPLKPDRVIVKIMRPVTNQFDEVKEMHESASGEYILEHSFAGLGQWEVRVKAQKGQDEYITSKRWVFE